ncbi:MAG: AraC family transcriptional regulator [Lachnospiraceae bacterium]|nr:AraC family transcriptional regulator [Lachnospiraceae bacterium]
MAKKKKETMEFRFYEVPQGEAALILAGEPWVRVYGHDYFKLHFHNLMEIGICRRGCGELRFNEDSLRYNTDSITMIPQNYPHITVSDGEDTNFWEYVFFDLRPYVEELFPENVAYQTKIIEAINRRAILTTRENASSFAYLIDSIIEEYTQNKPFCQKMIKIYVEAMVMDLIRRNDMTQIRDNISKTNSISQITKTLEYVEKNYSKNLKAEELAGVSSMSETHFRRIFEANINMSPMDYVNLIRVQKACDLMKKNDDSMDVIASKCGFVTTSTFNRNFKKFLGTSPYQWKINPENYEHKLLNFKISALKGWD